MAFAAAKKTISDGNRPKKAAFIKKRFLIALMVVLCPIVCYISRQNLSMAIVAMVDEDGDGAAVGRDGSAASNNSMLPPDLTEPQHVQSATNKFNTCPAPTELDESGNVTTRAKSYGPKYNWSQSQRSLPFEAFFWTYVLFQIPCARIAEKLGAKWILATATVGSSLLSIISPWAASLDSLALAAVRASMGVVQTALFPACYVILTKWLPPRERSQVLPIVMVGSYVGSIISSSSTGFFSEQEQFGWPYAFYLPAVLCAVWSLVWFYSGTSEPRQHSTISLEELEFIEASVAASAKGLDERVVDEESKNCISWPKLLKSQHVWAMNAAMFASNWSFTIVLLLLPSYLNSVLHIPPFKNGMINSVIYILYCITSPLVGSCSTIMIETRPFGMSRLNIRKLFESVALFGQAVCFVALPLIGCNTTLVLGVLFGQIVLFSFCNGGEVQIPSELSVNFAGTIYAIGNCIGSTTGFIVPRVHSWIVSNPRDQDLWNVYFYLAAFVSALGGLIFVVFGKNDMQDFSRSAKKLEHERPICKVKRGTLSHPFADVYLDRNAEAKSWRKIDIDNASGWLGATN